MHRPDPAANLQTQPVAGVLRQALHTLRLQYAMDVAFLCIFRAGERVLLLVDRDPDAVRLREGSSDPLGSTLCQRVADGRLPAVLPDARLEPEVPILAAALGWPVGAYLAAPVRFESGELFGTVCCFRAQPHPGLQPGDTAAVHLLTALVARLLEGEVDATRSRLARCERLARLMREGQLEAVYQPILNVARQTLVGYEALTRFHCDPQHSPQWWFDEAGVVGMQAELETAAVATALRGLPRVPRHAYLSVNVSPATLLDPAFTRLLAGQPLARLVLELTEHACVEDYDALAARLAPLRAKGLRVAVDDAGAGFASFRHILRLRPDVIKLDGSLIARIDRDGGARALAGAIVGFAEETGSAVVAEGVETEAELEVLRALRVDKAQGFLLGHPAPLPGYAPRAPCQALSSAAAAEISTATVDKPRPGTGEPSAETAPAPVRAGLLRD